MNQAHVHLLLNHLPIIIPAIGLLVMLGGYFFKSEIVKRTAYSIFILGAIVAIPTFQTGEGAEELVEKLPGFDKEFIERHAHVAETFAILCYVLGGLSLLGLWANWKHKSFSMIIGLTTIVFSLVVLVFAKETGATGGEIRHNEIRTQPVGGVIQAALPERGKKLDDDNE